MRISDWSSDVCSSELFEGDLNRLFAELDANATILTEELRDLMISRAKALAAKKVPADDFWNHPSIKQWPGLVQTTPRKADDRRKAAFLAERTDEHTSELQSLMPSSYAVFCLKK